MFYYRPGNIVMNMAYGFAMADMMSHSCHHRPYMPFFFGGGCGYFNPYYMPYSPYFRTLPPQLTINPTIYQPTYPQYAPSIVGDSLLNVQPPILSNPWTPSQAISDINQIGDLLKPTKPVAVAEIEEIEGLLNTQKPDLKKKTSTVPTKKASTVSQAGGKVKVSKDVLNKVKSIAAKINCDYKDLLGLIYSESTFRTVPKNWNGKSAVGLIQFTNTCIADLNKVYGLNLTKAKIAKMSVMEQLDLAEKSLLRAKEVAGFNSDYRLSAGELAAINYLPKYAKRDIVTRRGGEGYAGNEGLDINGDGKITKSELNQRIKEKSLCVVA